MKDYGIALIERRNDNGLTKAEVVDLFDILSGVTAIPIEIQGDNSSALGFINLTDADLLDYAYDAGTELYRFIQNILDGMEQQNETGEYVFHYGGGEISIFLGV